MDSIHKFTVEGIDGVDIEFAQFKGKKILVVNVASVCGYTPQYKQLQELFEEFRDKLVIVGFPCNDFGNQEPGSNEAIKEFCSINYGVRFPITAKVTINKGIPHPVYKWLMNKSLNGVMDSEVRWNFQKYLIDEKGHLVNYLPSSISPIDEVVLDWVTS